MAFFSSLLPFLSNEFLDYLNLFALFFQKLKHSTHTLVNIKKTKSGFIWAIHSLENEE